MTVNHIERHKWVASLPLSGIENAVLRVLADYANHKTLKCWPSLKTIGEESGFCKKSILRALRSLLSKGLIDVKHSHGRTPNVYLLRIPNRAPETPLKNGNGIPQTPQQCPRDTVNGIPERPEPVNKPVNEPVNIFAHRSDARVSGFSGSKEAEDELFTEFCAEYEVKKDKARTLREWRKLNPTPELARCIIEALKAQKRARYGNGSGGFTPDWPYAARWLRDKRWEDDVMPSKRAPVRPTRVVL
ncbi:MAG: helix-turn-helix domain-containing protein [Gammaproteobacteria bacterium]